MRSLSVQFTMCFLCVLGVFIGAGNSADAQSFFYMQDFDQADYSVPSGWSVCRGSSSEVRIVDNALQANRVANYSMMAIYDGWPHQSWNDYIVQCRFRKGWWNDTTGTWIGVVARVNTTNPDEHYIAALMADPYGTVGGTNKLVIARSTSSGLVELASARDFYYSRMWWSLKFTLEGSNLTAQLSDQFGVQIATVSAVDTAYSEGVPGVRAVLGDSSYEKGQWDDFSAYDINTPLSCGQTNLAGYGLAGDVNSDCVVDLADWAGFVDHHQQANAAPGQIDFDHDGILLINGQRTFLYAAYRDPTDDWRQFDMLLQAGFNLTHSYHFENLTPTGQPYTQDIIDQYITEATEYLDLAQQAGIGVMLGLPREVLRTADVGSVEQIVLALKDKPALWFWYSLEEPSNMDNRELPVVEALELCHQRIHELDDVHPILHYNGEYFAVYARTADFVFPASYPLPESFIPINDVISDVQRDLPCTPFTALLGAYDGRSRNMEMTDTAFRPNAQEIRCQAHYAIAQGSNSGIAYYWGPNYWFDLIDTSIWMAMEDLGQEFQQLSNVLLSTQTPANITLTTEFPMQRSSDGHVAYWSRSYQDKLYVGIVNASYNPNVKVTLDLPFNFQTVTQLPADLAVINNSSGTLSFDHANIPVLMVPSQSDSDTLTFFMKEYDTVIWCMGY